MEKKEKEKSEETEAKVVDIPTQFEKGIELEGNLVDVPTLLTKIYNKLSKIEDSLL